MRKYLGTAVLLVLVFGVATTTVLAQQATLSFSPNSKSAQVGTPFTADIVVNTAGAEAAGTGAKLTYDPEKLVITNIEAGKIFGDYPVLAHDNELGQAHISGIVNNPNTRFTGQGVLATITFLPTEPGSSKVDFVFQPNSTTDSNVAVTTGTGDILSSVASLTVVASGTQELSEEEIQTITQDSQPEPPNNSSSPGNQSTGFLSRLLNWLNPKNLFFSTSQSTETDSISAEGELPSLPSRQSLTQSQPEANVVIERSNFSPLLLVFFVLVIAILAVAVIVMWRKINRLASSSNNSGGQQSHPQVNTHHQQPLTQSVSHNQTTVPAATATPQHQPQPTPTTQVHQPLQHVEKKSSPKPPPHAAHFR